MALYLWICDVCLAGGDGMFDLMWVCARLWSLIRVPAPAGGRIDAQAGARRLNRVQMGTRTADDRVEGR
jgi:hypothetical protein